MKPSVAYGLSGIALLGMIITLISLATPHWIEGDLNNYVGLWKRCNILKCVDFAYSDLPSYLKAVQGFLFIAMFMYSIACIFAIMVGKKKVSGKSMVGFFLITALCTVVAMAIYTAKTSNNLGNSYGYSYILGWISFVLSLIFVVISALFNKISDYSTL